MRFAAVGIGLTFIIMLIIAIGLLDEEHPTPVVIVTDSLRLTPAPDQPLYFPISPNPLLDSRPVVVGNAIPIRSILNERAQPPVPYGFPGFLASGVLLVWNPSQRKAATHPTANRLSAFPKGIIRSTANLIKRAGEPKTWLTSAPLGIVD